ncbi:keratin, type II cytoskeletal 1b-like isoform X1 [Amphibalanus amphitrite]|uniref:keratin, type II cytoskeletal 1b-like isoform X1 n=1 Tax=Amphibalanus amphitrite TaxID=1232801 RepID=UPI001C90DF38|nr:keratin, type II cytoskeletal 1b-like isoform X1 [Amphibalanus amphitrite]
MYRLPILFLLCVSAARAYDEYELESNSIDDELDPRFLFFNATGSLIPLSASSVLASLGLLATLALLGIGFWLLLSSIGSKFSGGFGGGYGGGYGGYGGGYGHGHGGYDGGYSGGSSYSSYGQARSASDPYSAVFDKLSILDWIAMMEEVYRNFDATKMECQQRIVCELHQNENTWGTTARKMNDAFSYLQYLELLNLPSEMRMLLDEYMDAANKGRTSQKTCEEMFSGCQFSIKNLITKYNGSNAI